MFEPKITAQVVLTVDSFLLKDLPLLRTEDHSTPGAYGHDCTGCVLHVSDGNTPSAQELRHVCRSISLQLCGVRRQNRPGSRFAFSCPAAASEFEKRCRTADAVVPAVPNEDMRVYLKLSTDERTCLDTLHKLGGTEYLDAQGFWQKLPVDRLMLANGVYRNTGVK